MDHKVLIIIPAHNEAETISRVIRGVRQYAPEHDLVVVNDGSVDATSSMVLAMNEKLINLSSNLGYGPALQTGMRYGLLKEYDILVTIDGDGQHRPEDIPHLVNALIENGADLVIGSRFGPGRIYNTPFSRRVGQLLFSHLTRILIGKRIYDTSSGFKAMTRNACQAIEDATFMDFHIETIVRLSMLGYKIVETPIIVLERSYGRSMHSIFSVFQYPLKTLLLTAAAAMDVLIERRTK